MEAQKVSLHLFLSPMPSVGRFKFVVWADKDNNVEAVISLLKAFYEKYGVRYIHGGEEYCPTTKRPHVDGYYEYDRFRKQQTELNKFNKTFGKGFGDLQIAYGTSGENIDYSEKEGLSWFKLGEKLPGAGTRTDLDALKDRILQGESVDSLAISQPEVYHQFARTLTKIEDIYLRKQWRKWMTTCEWIYGPTGVGKSHKAFDGYDPDTHYVWKDDKGWQDGYTGQPTVIINDFRGHIKYNDLLQMIDKFPFTVSRRGKEPAPFLAKHVIITSSQSPAQVYNKRDEEDSLDQLLRRITVTYVPSIFQRDLQD